MSQHYQQRKKANEKYLSTQDRITIRVSKESGLKAAIEEHVKTTSDQSVQAFIIRAILETMERDTSPQRLIDKPSFDNWNAE